MCYELNNDVWYLDRITVDSLHSASVKIRLFPTLGLWQILLNIHQLVKHYILALNDQKDICMDYQPWNPETASDEPFLKISVE